MKASVTFEFNQNDDLDVTSRIAEVTAYGRLAAALHEIYLEFRSREKYGDAETIPLQEARKIINDAIEAHDLNTVIHGA